MGGNSLWETDLETTINALTHTSLAASSHCQPSPKVLRAERVEATPPSSGLLDKAGKPGRKRFVKSGGKVGGVQITLSPEGAKAS